MQSDDEPTITMSPVPRPRARWSGGRTALVTTIVTVLLAGASVLAWPVLFRPAVASSTGGEVYRESTTDPGHDPFSGTVVVGNPPGTKSQTPMGATGGTVPTISGDVPALYGGSRNEHVCDRQKLISFLQQHPDKAAAWAGVLGVSAADIATYIATLTPMQLRADTRVTNHGFVDGHATSLQSVLQAGTAVLADAHGRPRVKCGCGNPLLDPIATPVTPVYTGDAWPDFSPRNVSAVAAATIQVDRFVVYDLRTGETFYRPSGTDGDQDQPTTPPAVATTAPPSPSPSHSPSHSPTVVSCPRGTHLSGAVCVANAPPRCPAGQVRDGGRCVPTGVSCPDGSHPSNDGTTCVRDQPGCPDGTHLDNGKCVDNGPQCGHGTHLEDGTCVDNPPTSKTCPPGTYAKSTLCVSDVIPTCQDGYHVSYTNKCIKDCPDGYRQAARDGCVPVHTSAPPAPCEGTTHGTVRSECGGSAGRRPGRRKRRSDDPVSP